MVEGGTLSILIGNEVAFLLLGPLSQLFLHNDVCHVVSNLKLISENHQLSFGHSQSVCRVICTSDYSLFQRLAQGYHSTPGYRGTF